MLVAIILVILIIANLEAVTVVVLSCLSVLTYGLVKALIYAIPVGLLFGAAYLITLMK